MKLPLKYDITIKYKKIEYMLKNTDINGLIEKNKKKLLVQQQKLEEIENKLSLLNINITGDKDSRNYINKRDGKFSLIILTN